MWEGIGHFFGVGANGQNYTDIEQRWPMHKEMYELVFTHLDNQGKLQCRAVCKTWKQLIEANHFWESFYPRYFNDSTKVNKDRFISTHVNLKTENFSFGKNTHIPFYEKYFFNAYPSFDNSLQQKLFKVQEGSVFYPMRNTLCTVSESDPETKTVEAYDVGIKALAIKGNIVLTSGIDKIKKTKVKDGNKVETTKRVNVVKVWDAQSLSLTASQKLPSVNCFGVIDERRFLSGHAEKCALREIKNKNGKTVIHKVAKLMHENPVVFAHYFQSGDQACILTQDSEKIIYLWSEQIDETGKAQWVKIKTLTKRKATLHHILVGVANMVFEGFTDVGQIRLNGGLKRKDRFFDLDFTAAVDEFKWMQFDAGNLYFATKDNIRCLDFTQDNKMNMSNNPKTVPFEKLEKDLEWVNCAS